MESEVRRREATTRLKTQVKRSAKRRRGIAQMESIASGIHADAVPDPGGLVPSPDVLQNPSHEPTHTTSVEPLRERIPPPATAQTEIETGFISVYMDYIFPIIFPFYQPYITQGGRHWLLSLAMKNTGFMNSIISTSYLFLSLVPAELGTGHRACASKTWDELQNQAHVALGSIQRELQHLRRRGVGNSLLESVHLLANMVQQLVFELAIMPSGNWQTHLDAATGLFEQILEHHGKAGSTPPRVSAVLSNLRRPSWAPGFLNTEQGAFRFFSSILLVADIISSTALNRRAKLLAYHHELRCSDLTQQPSLDLEGITGCQTWVLLVISDISTLSWWKKDQMMSDEFSRNDLIRRATSIERTLHNGLDNMDRYGNREKPSASVRPLESLLNQSRSPNGQPCALSETRLSLTRIWIHAARTYLLSVTLEEDTKVSELEIIVEQAIHSFGAFTSSTWLRLLAWPLCVTGIYASKELRPAVREITDSMCNLKAFGTIRAALNIIEQTWQSRDRGEGCLDLPTSLGSMGFEALLV